MRRPREAGEDARASLQEGLAFAYELLFWVYLVLFGTAIVVYSRFPEIEPERVWLQHGLSLVALAGALCIWLTARRERSLSMPALLAFDGAFVPLIGIHFGLLTYLNSPDIGPPVVLFVYCSLSMIGRSLLVPSSVQRTGLIAGAVMACWLLAMIALTVQKPGVLGYPPVASVLFSIVLAVASAALATANSASLDGLRRRARDASRACEYELFDPLGDGGSVYGARSLLLRRPLAVELVEGAADDGRREHFERQLELAASLDHPAAAIIFDYGRGADGELYCARELLDGIDLERLVAEEGAQPPGRAIHLLADLCDLLAAAHARGLVHRGLEPSRILVRDRGRAGEAVGVVGFALAAAAPDPDRDPEAAARLSRRSPFAAPEAAGSAEEAVDASDLYSLGAVGWFLVTGEPARGRSAERVPEELAALLEACLEEEPEDRPSGAAELREALLALPEAAAWDPERARTWWKARGDGGARPRLAGARPRRRLAVDLAGRDGF